MMKKLFACFLALLILCSFCSALAEYTDADTILKVQQALHDAGYYKGNLSGIKGNATESAIRAYQQAKGLKNSGQIDDELLAALGLGGNAAEAPAEEKPGSAADGVSGGVSFTVKTNKEYGESLLVYENAIIKIYLDKVSFTEKNSFGENIMTVTFACDVDEKVIPCTPGYGATADLTSIRVGGKTAKQAYNLSNGLMGEHTKDRYLSFPVENPGKQPLDLEIQIKNGRYNPFNFSFKVGPVHIEIDGDLYDGAGDMKAETTAASVGLGALLYKEPVTLVDQKGVKIKATGIAYQPEGGHDGGKITFSLLASNQNEHPVVIDFASEEHPTPTTWKIIYFMLNGQEYDYTISEKGGISIGATELRLPAGAENAAYTLTVLGYETPLPTLEELESGRFAFHAYMATTEELTQYTYTKWPELFVIDPFTFDMSYDGELPETEADFSLPFPSLTASFFDTALFSHAGVSFYAEYADIMSQSENKARVYINGTLQNDTDRDLSVSLDGVDLAGTAGTCSVLIFNENGESAGYVPAHAAAPFRMILTLNGDVMNATEFSAVLRYMDSQTEKNVVYQPVVFIVGDR